MKKILSLLLVLVMLLSICACNKKEAKNTHPSANSSQATTDNTEESTNSTNEDEQESTENSITTPGEDEKETIKQPTSDGNKQESIEKPATSPTKDPATAPTQSTQSPTVESTTTSTQTPTTKPDTCEHTYTVATCTIPKVCTKCEKIGGHTLPHSYKNGVCTVCGKPEILVTFKEGDWVARIVKAGTREQGEILSQYRLSKDKHSYENVVCYSNASSCVVNLGKIIYNEKTYYADYYPTTFFSVTWEENGDTITIVSRHNDQDRTEFVLTKTSETQLTVTSSNDKANISVGTVFNKV